MIDEDDDDLDELEDDEDAAPAARRVAAAAPVDDGSWRRDGHCAACTFFRDDFGAPPEILGHCKMYPRTVSRSSDYYACREYKPREGFDDIVRLKEALPTRITGGSGPSGGSGRARSGGGGVVRRRSSDDGPETITVAEGLVSDDFLAAFASGSGDGEDDMDTEALRRAMLSVIESFISVEDVELGAKWHGGTLILQPANAELKPYEMPLEAFFHKIVMIRDKLRVLEAKLNAHDALSPADKVELQQYVSRCYGSLTSFNALFKNKDDYFSSK